MVPQKVLLVKKHLHEWDRDKSLWPKSICMNDSSKGTFGRKAFELMGSRKMPLVGKHLHKWDPVSAFGQKTFA